MKKEKGLVLKKFDMDYSFILKNYLNPELWQKEWNLFVYKEFVISLKLSSIDCSENEICFSIKVKDTGNTRDYYYEWGRDYDKYSSTSIRYNLGINNIEILKRKIESAIYNCILTLEKRYIRSLSDYRDIKEFKNKEIEQLEAIANQFLDDNNVSNEEIRDVYVENYVENNSTIDNRLREFVDKYEYTLFTDFYLTFVNSTNNESLEKLNNNNLDKINNIEDIKQEVEEYMAQMETEEFKEQLADNLEDI